MIDDSFTAVPMWRGERLDVACTEEEYDFYLAWLADYLYRPTSGEANLAVEDFGVSGRYPPNASRT